MKAVQLHQFGSADELFIGEVADPVASPSEVLVKVHASALNRADLLQRQGNYPPPPGASDILGLEMAGEIIDAGQSSQWKVGDRVMALLAGGGQAEIVAVPESLLMAVPSLLNYFEAAAIPEVFLTAYQAIFYEGKAMPGQTMLVHAAASGVGTAAIQLAKAKGLKVIATCSSGKLATCIALGANSAIDYRAEDFAEAVDKTTGGKGVELVLDFIGAPNFNRNIQVLAIGGKLIQIAMMGGQKVADISLAPILRNHLTIIGTTLRSRPLAYKASLTSSFVNDFYPLLEQSVVKPIIDRVYPLANIAEAHRHMEANKNIGKIVLQVIS